MAKKQTKQSRKTARRKARQEIVFRKFLIASTLAQLPKGFQFSDMSERSKFRLIRIARATGVI